MTKAYYEWRTNQELERLVLFEKQDANAARLTVRHILNREQAQDLAVLERIIQRGKESEAHGLATESLDSDMLAELKRLKQVLRDRSESYRASDRKWRLEHWKQMQEQQEGGRLVDRIGHRR